MTELEIKKVFRLISKHFPKQVDKNRFECTRFGGKRTCIVDVKDKRVCLFLHYDIKGYQYEIAKDIPKLEYQQFVFFPKKLSDVKAILNSLEV